MTKWGAKKEMFWHGKRLRAESSDRMILKILGGKMENSVLTTQVVSTVNVMHFSKSMVRKYRMVPIIIEGHTFHASTTLPVHPHVLDIHIYRVIQNDWQGFNNLSYTIHLVLQMQPHVISFYGVTWKIRFTFLLFPQVSRNWRLLHDTDSLERTRLSCWCL